MSLLSLSQSFEEPASRPLGTFTLRQLQRIEDDLVDALKRATDAADLDSLRQSAATEVAPHAARMSPEAVEATISRVIDRRIRERYAVPKLI